MAVIWIGSWLVQSVTGLTDCNDDQRAHDEPTASCLGYVGSARFLQNRQSE